MAKQSLAVRYRPTTFDDVVEQDIVKQILQYQLKTKTFQHVYLFCGSAGCSKTTQARIFAQELNEGVGEPIEIDVASHNGVDDMRSIVQDAHIKPIGSEYKIFILDEVHAATSNFWSAALKIFEDVPETAIFIMCTTDPQKIPQTILSRVQRFNFTRISTKGIFGRLKYIVECENKEGNNYTYTDDALNYLARMANGGMRQAISLMDRCLSLNPNLTMENVISCLGTLDYDTYFDLLMYLTTNSHQSAVQLIERVYNEGKDLQQFITNFEYFVIDVCKYKLCNSFDYIDIPNVGGYKQRLDDESYEFDVVVLQWLRGVVVDVKRNSNPRAYITASIMLLEVE